MRADGWMFREEGQTDENCQKEEYKSVAGP